MRAISLFILLFFFGINSFAQKMSGLGAELSVLSFKPNVRIWTSKTTGFEFFAGSSSELNNFKPNDIETGFKFLRTIIYKRTDRTYFGLVGKWKWINVYGDTDKTSLPIAGLLIGKEWYSKRINLKGYAIELGYQYGVKEYPI
ncbi:MAG: hypothetical protein Q7W54_07275, partial [Bacteroidota bacterium]|nr:hypothetical protein [Bacteroidota bacterium]